MRSKDSPDHAAGNAESASSSRQGAPKLHDNHRPPGSVFEAQDPGDHRRLLVTGDDQCTFGHRGRVSGFVEERPEVTIVVATLDITGDVEFERHLISYRRRLRIRLRPGRSEG